MRVILIFAAALLANNASAASVFKCVDAAGRVTFTQQNCPPSSDLKDVVSATNSAPSGSSAASRMDHDAPLERLGGVNVSGTAVSQDAPAQVAPRQENTPHRKPVKKQRFADNCVRWVDRTVRTPVRTPTGIKTRHITTKVAVPCG